MEFQVTVVTKSDETASREIKRKPAANGRDKTRKEKIKKRTAHWLYFRALVTLKLNLIIVIYYSRQSIIMNKNSENFSDYVKKCSWEIKRLYSII